MSHDAINPATIDVKNHDGYEPPMVLCLMNKVQSDLNIEKNFCLVELCCLTGNQS